MSEANTETSDAAQAETTTESSSPAPQIVTAAAAREIPISKLDIRRLMQLDACTRCGECLTWCPVYDQDAKESIIPRTKIRDFLKIVKSQQGLLHKIMKQERLGEPFKKLIRAIFRYRDISDEVIEEFARNLYECSTCGQCHVVCPANIDTVTLWEDIRQLIVEAGYGPLESQQTLVKSVKSYDNPWQQPRQARTKWARRAKKEQLITDLPREIKKTNAKVLLFFGCTAVYDVNVKQIAINTINILESLGVDYGCLGGNEKCCGSVLLRMGDKEFERIAADNIKTFNNLNIQTLVTSCSGCFKTIRDDYPHVGKLNFEVLHIVEYLQRLREQGKLKFITPVEKVITYHDPCHLGRATGVFDEPRLIIEAIPGLELVEMPRSREYSRCCGAGGGLKAGYPDIQNKMAQRRVKEAEATGAQELVSACPFCYAGLQVGISALDSPLVMKDVTSLVAESLKAKE
jgi:heterodisulfide reductase subunit D